MAKRSARAVPIVGQRGVFPVGRCRADGLGSQRRFRRSSLGRPKRPCPLPLGPALAPALGADCAGPCPFREPRLGPLRPVRSICARDPSTGPRFSPRLIHCPQLHPATHRPPTFAPCGPSTAHIRTGPFDKRAGQPTGLIRGGVHFQALDGHGRAFPGTREGQRIGKRTAATAWAASCILS